MLSLIKTKFWAPLFIPQKTPLFKGSIQTNLDPLGLYADDDIWKALEKCQLKDIIIRLSNLLDSFGQIYFLYGAEDFSSWFHPI